MYVYSPKKGPVGFGLTPSDASELTKKVIVHSSRDLSRAHLGTHFSISGDSPVTYDVALGRTGGAAAAAAATSIGAAVSSSSTTTTTFHQQHQQQQQQQQQKAIPHFLTRHEIRQKMRQPHFLIAGPDASSSSSSGRPSTASSSAPASTTTSSSTTTTTIINIEPRVPASTFAHPQRSIRHLDTCFTVYDPTPMPSRENSEITKERLRVMRHHDVPTAPSDAGRAAHAKRQEMLSTHFSL